MTRDELLAKVEEELARTPGATPPPLDELTDDELALLLLELQRHAR